MALSHLTDSEIALRVAVAVRAWRVSPEGAGMTQAALAERSGVGTTSLKRFEKTGAITLRNLIAILRALGLVDRLEDLVPQPDSPGPLAMLQAERARKQRRRAPRRPSVSAKRTDVGGHG
jgi:transcriptional regulator with XRE-family HTH domain